MASRGGGGGGGGGAGGMADDGSYITHATATRHFFSAFFDTVVWVTGRTSGL